MSKKFWNFIKNQADDNKIDLRIDGEIVESDFAWFYEWLKIPYSSPNKFREALAEHKGKDITVWIDSWGGDVFAGVGIYNALKEHDGKVIVKIDGKAVSAGSIIAMAGEKVLMAPGSIMMTHNPWSYAAGEAKDMLHMAEVLDEIKESIINIYEIKTGRSREELSTLMDEETWMSAKKAVAEGFADGILYEEEADPEPVKNFMVSRLAIQNSARGAMEKFLEIRQGELTGGSRPLAKLRDIAAAKIKTLEEEEGPGLDDWLYLIHHVHVDPDTGKEIIHHCNLVDHLGNLYEVGHVINEDGEISHGVLGLVEDQDVYWSNEEAEADGQEIPCANRQLGDK